MLHLTRLPAIPGRKENNHQTLALQLLFSFTLLLPLWGTSQQKTQHLIKPVLETIHETFSDTSTLQAWHTFHETEAYESKIKRLSIEKGKLFLQPYASGWYADYQAPYIFKTVEGDFDVQAKVMVTGMKDSLPQSEWSLGGLMVREAKSTTAVNWQPRMENWLFLTTGIAQPKGHPVFEVKSTYNSSSNLKLRPAKAGWVYLRIVRVQASFLLMYRYENENWSVLERFYRPLLPQRLQVGITAYSGWNDIPENFQADPVLFNRTVLQGVNADMLLQVDDIKFALPTVNQEKLQKLVQKNFVAPYYTGGNLLSDYAISNDDVLQILRVNHVSN
ncbi:MAG TPA: hypothetical protein VGN63_04095 [Flavisolibacter sp.]|jgi:hypothetical protein|nr:hypothetical protein [Flavisolibacter sp.]